MASSTLKFKCFDDQDALIGPDAEMFQASYKGIFFAKIIARTKWAAMFSNEINVELNSAMF
ncbi:hypothetical protein [Bdellovibrio sp. BCCA]|uniref:hypothetical protein n=1 Tax=Bdellovibrio sp. BCCA TaxID=3136281 RepID=UPI0030F2A787